MQVSDTFVTAYGTFATGAVPKVPDARDHQLERVPSVAAALEAPLPKQVDRSDLIKRIYNQGAEPSCVAFSSASVMQAFEVAEVNKVIDFDGHAAYIENGGDGRSGVPADRLLKKVKADGFPVAGSKLRYKVSSYQWTDDVHVICAALAAGRLCVIACLLPYNFLDYDRKSDDNPSSSYHQLCVTGYDIDAGWLYGPNSWGTTFGRNGFYKLELDYLGDKAAQKGYFYGYSLTDAPDGDAVPLPTPQPPPVPKPEPVRAITGVGIEVRTYQPRNTVQRGDEFIIRGTGFGSQRGQFSWGSAFVTVRDWSDTRISALAPAPLMPGARAPLSVKTADGAVVLGPTLTIR